MTMTTPPGSPPILDSADLTDRWRMLMGPLGFGYRRLYLAFIELDGRMLPNLVDIDQVPAVVGLQQCRSLLEMCRGALEDPATSVAVLYCRPGAGPVTDGDRSWSDGLRTAAAREDLRLWPTHLACDDLLTVL